MTQDVGIVANLKIEDLYRRQVLMDDNRSYLGHGWTRRIYRIVGARHKGRRGLRHRVQRSLAVIVCPRRKVLQSNMQHPGAGGFQF